MFPVDVARRQRVLDSAAVLQGLRQRVVGELGHDAAAVRPGVELVASGGDLAGWLMRDAWTWRHVLSTRDVTTVEQLKRSMPNNRALVGSGLLMTSVFDHSGTDPAARALLESAPDGVYFYGFAPLQVRIVNHEAVYMHGPSNDGDSILRLTFPAAVRAALAYWGAVSATLAPCTPQADGPVLTARQRRILELLCEDLGDERIAEALTVSVRTVRYEIAHIMRTLEVRSRFAAGYRFATLNRAEHPTG